MTAVADLPAADPRREAAAPACLYCHGTDTAPLYCGVRDRLGYVPGERTWHRCRDCGSAVLVPLPRTENLAAFYPPVYSFTPEMGKRGGLARVMAWLEYHFFFRPQYVSEARAVMRNTGGGRAGKRLLDIGAGRGLRLLEFRRLGYDVHALDLQDDVCRYLNDELRIPAVRADVSEADQFFDRESFDIVTAFYLMEHIPDVAGFLRSCFDLLKPGGWIAVAIPFVDSVQADLFGDRWINVTEAPRHLSLPTQDGARRAVREAGFERVAIVPDALSNCAGSFASSVVTGATLTHAYSKPGLRAFAPRFVGAAAMLAALPFCVVENYVADRMPLGIVCARKPDPVL